MSKIQKTFYEDDEISIVMNWIDGVIWSHTYQTQPRDPAEIENRLSNKIKIIIIDCLYIIIIFAQYHHQ